MQKMQHMRANKIAPAPPWAVERCGAVRERPLQPVRVPDGGRGAWALLAT